MTSQPEISMIDPSSSTILEQVRNVLERHERRLGEQLAAHEKKLGDQLSKHENNVEDRFRDMGRQLGAIKEQLAGEGPSNANRDKLLEEHAGELKEIDKRIGKVETQQARNSWIPVLLSVFVLGMLGSVGTAVWAVVKSPPAAPLPAAVAAPVAAPQPIIIYTTAAPASTP
jgi:hypothetical protein